jgi:hypothetical protein
MKEAMDWLGRTLRDLTHGEKHGGRRHEHANGCCAVTETCCSPRCAGELKWKIVPGALPEAAVLVRNVGKSARQFTFSATPLLGVDPGSAKLSVVPATAQLGPGESTVVRVKLDHSIALSACQEYRAEVLIQGAWQQCVEVFIAVSPVPFDQVSVEQSGSSGGKALLARACGSAIEWKIQRGVVPEGAITVHNTGESMKGFGFETTPLVGPSAAGARIVMTPDVLQLAPGQTGVVRLALQGSAALSPGQTYHCDVRIRGFHEGRVAIKCSVEPDASGQAVAEHGEAPTRTRAHNWYDHFQCTESCVPHVV